MKILRGEFFSYYIFPSRLKSFSRRQDVTFLLCRSEKENIRELPNLIRGNPIISTWGRRLIPCDIRFNYARKEIMSKRFTRSPHFSEDILLFDCVYKAFANVCLLSWRSRQRIVTRNTHTLLIMWVVKL